MENLLTGFDLSKLGVEAIFERLGQLALISIKFANFLALLGAIFYVATLLMRTIIPLRVSAIISDVLFRWLRCIS